MSAQGFSVGIYRDQDTGRQRWAVVGPADAWYFPRSYGKRAAQTLCRRLNRMESAPCKAAR
jgi:hypothetical protein